jgi:putative alpha-1,2-mannosidase
MLSNDPSNVLTIETENNSDENVYIQGINFNGKPINNSWINRAKLMKGGLLKFKMGSEPNKNFGVKIPPPSMSTEQ